MLNKYEEILYDPSFFGMTLQERLSYYKTPAVSLAIIKERQDGLHVLSRFQRQRAERTRDDQYAFSSRVNQQAGIRRGCYALNAKRRNRYR